jgi:cysteinyl-tRNA synthetase
VMANVWMHNGFLQVEGQKMSKSLGNFLTIHEALQRWGNHSWPGEAVRFNMLRAHYREPIDWTFSSLDEAHKYLWDMYSYLADKPLELVKSETILHALNDDLNTAMLRKIFSDLRKENAYGELRWSLNLLGFSADQKNLSRNAFAVAMASGASSATGLGEAIFNASTIDPTEIQLKITARLSARAAKDWKESDRIRDELAAMGVTIKDNKDGTTSWEVKR